LGVKIAYSLRTPVPFLLASYSYSLRTPTRFARMDPPRPHANISFGKNNTINHSWCILFGDGLSTTKDYDIQLSTNVTVPSNIDSTYLQNKMTAIFEEFKLHVTLAPPGWIDQASLAVVKIMMVLGKARKCRVGCDNTSTSTDDFVCQKCRNVRYCSSECRDLDQHNHLKDCVKVEVRDRDPSIEFNHYLNTLESRYRGIWWTPSTALDKGLFATTKMREGDVIVFFDGHIVPIEEAIRGDEWFRPIPNGKAFVPSKNDVAHMAMDPSFTAPDPRVLIEALSSPISLITTIATLQNVVSLGSGGVCNATAVVSHNSDFSNFKMALVATRSINPGEEIFFHRGFSYHFMRESKRGWLMIGDSGVGIGELPANIYSSPGFKAYVNLFHPRASDMYISLMDPSEGIHKVQLVILPKGKYPEKLNVHFEEMPLDDGRPKGETESRVVTMVLPDYRRHIVSFV